MVTAIASIIAIATLHPDSYYIVATMIMFTACVAVEGNPINRYAVYLNAIHPKIIFKFFLKGQMERACNMFCALKSSRYEKLFSYLFANTAHTGSSHRIDIGNNFSKQLRISPDFISVTQFNVPKV